MEFDRLLGLIFLLQSAAGQYQTKQLILVPDMVKELTLAQDRV